MSLGQALRESGAIDSIARELGVDPQMAQTGAAILLPAIMAGMGRSSVGSGGSASGSAGTSGLGGLGDLIGAVVGAGGGDLLDMVTGNQPSPVERGNDILGQIFGNKDVSRSVATEAAGASGLSSDLLKRMLPLLAMAVAGYLARQGGQGGQAAPAAPAAPDLGGLVGSIIGGFMRR